MYILVSPTGIKLDLTRYSTFTEAATAAMAIFDRCGLLYAVYEI